MRSSLAAVLHFAAVMSTGVLASACVSPAGSPSSAEVPGQLAPVSLSFVDDYDFATGTMLDGLELGGLSSLWIDPRTGRGLALSDGHEEHGPPRFYSLRVSLTRTTLTVEPTSHTTYDTGSTPAAMMDAEGIARSPSGEIFISSEGKPRASPPVPPAIVRVLPSGQLIGALPMPAKMVPNTPQTRGIRHNKALESIAISPSGNALFAATEHALLQDGPGPTFDLGTRCRILRYDIGLPQPALSAEYVYETDPIPRPPGPHEIEAKGIGVAEMLALTDWRLLVLERAGVKTNGTFANTIRLYEVDLRGAVDVANQDPLAANARPLDKRLVLELDAIQSPLDPRYPSLDNFEGMSLGPPLADGRRTLILVSDNNFKQAQRTAFFAFAFDE